MFYVSLHEAFLLKETISSLWQRHSLIPLLYSIHQVSSLGSVVKNLPANAAYKMLIITLYAEQKKKRHRFIEQSFRLCGRRRGWYVSREQHRNMYSI